MSFGFRHGSVVVVRVELAGAVAEMEVDEGRGVMAGRAAGPGCCHLAG